MTDFLTIAGTAYPVQATGASENEPEYTGSRERAFDNTYRSTRDHPKRNWQFILGPITPAAYDTLIAATRPDIAVTVDGAMLNGGSAVTAFVDVTSDFVVDKLTFMKVVHAIVTET